MIDAKAIQPETTPNQPLAVGVEEAARMAGLSRAYVFRAIAENELVTFKAGRRRLVLVKELEAWLNRMAKEGAQ